MNGNRTWLSVVVPVYNEDACITEFCTRLEAALADYRRSWEVVFVDDGSTDGTANLLQQIVDRDKRYRSVPLEGNFGREAAVCAGLRFSSGRYIATIPVDLQYAPTDIRLLVDKIENSGLDIVTAFVEKNEAGSEKYRCVDQTILSRATGGRLKDAVCSLRVYSRKLVDRAQSYHGNTYSPQTLLPRIAHSFAQVGVNRYKRFAGENKLPRGPLALSPEFRKQWTTVDLLSVTGMVTGGLVAVSAVLAAAFGGVFGLDSHTQSQVAEISERFAIAIGIVGIFAGLGIALLSWLLKRTALTLLPVPEPVRYDAARRSDRQRLTEGRSREDERAPDPRAPRAPERTPDRPAPKPQDRPAPKPQDRPAQKPQEKQVEKQVEKLLEKPLPPGPVTFETVVMLDRDEPRQDSRPAPKPQPKPKPETNQIRLGGEFDDIDELDDDDDIRPPKPEPRSRRQPATTRTPDPEPAPEKESTEEGAEEVDPRVKDPRLANTRRRPFYRRPRRPSTGDNKGSNESS